MLQLLPRVEKPEFSVFYREWYQKAVQYTCKKIGNIHDAEDLVSEVFLYCYDHYDSYDPSKSAISTWLFLIVNSRIKNHYRDAKDHVDLETVVGIVADDRIDMDDCLYAEELVAYVHKAVLALPERKRQIIQLRYYEGKTSEEIAKIMGITPVNARVLLSRAVGTLEKNCAEFIKGDR